MRKTITTTLIVIISAHVLVQSGVIDSLIVFLLSGSLPGTPFVVPPSIMMLGLIAAACITITRITHLDVLHFVAVRRLVRRYVSKQERMPKRRYSRI